MREDMAKVIVERPRRGGGKSRKGRVRPLDELPAYQGMRRPSRISGNWKELNENLQPLRRYLERQVGRPWNKVFSEIAVRLRVDSTVQQHVRDHLRNFVAFPTSAVPRYGWYQSLFVDPKDGILKWAKKGTTKWSKHRPPKRKEDRRPLGPDRELRLIGGLWYEVRLAPLPEPAYRAVTETRALRLRPWRSSSPTVDVTMDVRRLATPAVHDVVTGAAVLAGPEIDDERSWKEYRRNHADRRYAVGKRTLSRPELRRYGLENDVPAD